MDRLYKIFDITNFDQPWGNIQTAYHGNSLRELLKFPANKMSEIKKEEVLNSVSIKNLLDDLGILKQEIDDSSFNDDLKKILFILVEQMRQAIEEYKIFGGIVRIEDSLNTAIGTLVRHRDKVKVVTDTKKIKGVWEFFAKVDNIIAKANDITPLLNSAKDLFFN